jgi:HEAT repeat protein
VVRALTSAVANHTNSEIRADCIDILGKMKAGQTEMQAILRDKDVHVRAKAFNVLAAADQISDPAVLVDALPSWNTREVAKAALLRYKDRAVRALTSAVSSHTNREVRVESIEILGQLKAGQAEIQAALQDKDEQVRTKAFNVLAAADHINDPVVLLNALTSWSTRTAAREALTRCKDRSRVVPALTTALGSHANKEVREVCAGVLGELKAGQTELRAALQDKEAGVRSSAVRALAVASKDQGLDFFVDLLKNNTHDDIRRAAVDALQTLGDPKIVPVLIETLGDKTVGYSARNVLEKFPQRAPMLLAVSVAAVANKDVKVRRACLQILKSEAEEGSANVFAQALKDEDAEARETAAESLQKGVRYRHVPALLHGLEDSESRVRSAAVKTLMECDDFTDPAPLLKLCKDTDANCRRAAVAALGQLRNPTAIPALVAALAEHETRETAEKALGQISDQAAVVQMLSGPLATSQDKAVRLACAKVLGGLDFDAAMTPLEKASRDSDAGVAKAATEALKKYSSE